MVDRAGTVKAKLLLLEGKRSDGPSFLGGLTRKGFLVDSVASGSAALAYLGQNEAEVVIINAASMRTSGKRICQSIRTHAPALPILLILDAGADPDEKLDANVILILPFTLQKLVNRIRPLIPVEQKTVIQTGVLSLDLEQRLARCEDRQVKLTPRLVTLLKILMEHPGEVVEREDLFKQVWATEYTGDTRTLDVHVSWLRQALEEDPRRPQYIKTVRGVGYRLDV
jgi:DNA-binding response OmpR family regulator